MDTSIMWSSKYKLPLGKWCVLGNGRCENFPKGGWDTATLPIAISLCHLVLLPRGNHFQLFKLYIWVFTSYGGIYFCSSPIPKWIFLLLLFLEFSLPSFGLDPLLEFHAFLLPGLLSCFGVILQQLPEKGYMVDNFVCFCLITYFTLNLKNNLAGPNHMLKFVLKATIETFNDFFLGALYVTDLWPVEVFKIVSELDIYSCIINYLKI